MPEQRKDSKKRIWRTLGFCSIFVASAAGAIYLPNFVSKNKKYSLTNNFSTLSYEGNKNRIDDFVNRFLNNSSNSLSGSLLVYGKDGLIGTNDNILTSNERSLISVNEANKNNLFKLELKSTILYALKKNKVKYELVNVKPYQTDSTYATAVIKLFYGEGQNYYERIYEYRDVNLYGFKKIPEQSKIDSYIEQIRKEPSKYFILKSDKFNNANIGDAGLYAKNIKTEDIDLNGAFLKELRQNNYWVSISSVSADKKNSALLKVVFSITFDNGDFTISSSAKETFLGNFDIEEGVDDPKSKIELFYKSNKDWVDNLGQYFIFTKDKDDNTEYTARQAYEKGLIKFTKNYTINSKMDEVGLSLSFKTFEEEKEILKTNPNELSVFNNEFDSATPNYRIYITSYEGTPLQYTKSFIILGSSQESDFVVSDQEKKMHALNAWLATKDLFIDDIIKIDKNAQNPLALSPFFLNNGVTYANGIYDVPFNYVKKQYEEFKKNKNNATINFEAPFIPNNSFIIDNSITLDTNFVHEDQNYNISEIINEIKTNLNSSTDFEKQIYDINIVDGEAKFLFNFSLGNEASGNIYTNIDALEISVSNLFIFEDEYNNKMNEDIFNWASQNKANIHIKLNQSEGLLTEMLIKDLIINRKFENIFSGVNVYNIPDNLFKFPGLGSSLKTEIDFEFFDDIIPDPNVIINWKSIDIKINFVIGNSVKSLTITKTFSDLISENQ